MRYIAVFAPDAPFSPAGPSLQPQDDAQFSRRSSSKPGKGSAFDSSIRKLQAMKCMCTDWVTRRWYCTLCERSMTGMAAIAFFPGILQRLTRGTSGGVTAGLCDYVIYLTCAYAIIRERRNRTSGPIPQAPHEAKLRQGTDAVGLPSLLRKAPYQSRHFPSMHGQQVNAGTGVFSRPGRRRGRGPGGVPWSH